MTVKRVSSQILGTPSPDPYLPFQKYIQQNWVGAISMS